ncbi:MAG: hypothetical protein ABJ349_20830, partial [Hyphomicrobiales bacterium]
VKTQVAGYRALIVRAHFISVFMTFLGSANPMPWSLVTLAIQPAFALSLASTVEAPCSLIAKGALQEVLFRRDASRR